jgi:hypothetical protein
MPGRERSSLEKQFDLKEKKDKIDQLLCETRKQTEIILKQRDETKLRDENNLYETKLLRKKIDEQTDLLLNMKDDNNDLLYRVSKVQSKLGLACVDRAPYAPLRKMIERLILIKWTPYCDKEKILEYYIIRAQYDNATVALKNQMKFDPNLKVLLDIQMQPNSVAVFLNIRSELYQKGVLVKGNNISIYNSIVTEEQLIEECMKVHLSRLEV